MAAITQRRWDPDWNPGIGGKGWEPGWLIGCVRWLDVECEKKRSIQGNCTVADGVLEEWSWLHGDLEHWSRSRFLREK